MSITPFLMGLRVLFFTACVAVGVASLMPQGGLPSLSLWDKLEHLLAYAVLSGLGMLGFKKPSERQVLVLGLVLYGGVLEIGQSFVPGRFPSLFDFISNGIGVAIGTIASLWLTAQFSRLRMREQR